MPMSLRENPVKKERFLQEEPLRPAKKPKLTESSSAKKTKPADPPKTTDSPPTPDPEEPLSLLPSHDIAKIRIDEPRTEAAEQVVWLAGLVLRAAFEIRKRRKAANRPVPDPDFDNKVRYNLFLVPHVSQNAGKTAPAWRALREVLQKSSIYGRMEFRAKQNHKLDDRVLHSFHSIRQALLTGPESYTDSQSAASTAQFLDPSHRLVLLEAISILADDITTMKALSRVVDQRMLDFVPGLCSQKAKRPSHVDSRQDHSPKHHVRRSFDSPKDHPDSHRHHSPDISPDHDRRFRQDNECSLLQDEKITPSPERPSLTVILRFRQPSPSPVPFCPAPRPPMVAFYPRFPRSVRPFPHYVLCESSDPTVQTLSRAAFALEEMANGKPRRLMESSSSPRVPFSAKEYVTPYETSPKEYVTPYKDVLTPTAAFDAQVDSFLALARGDDSSSDGSEMELDAVSDLAKNSPSKVNGDRALADEISNTTSTETVEGHKLSTENLTDTRIELEGLGSAGRTSPRRTRHQGERKGPKYRLDPFAEVLPMPAFDEDMVGVLKGLVAELTDSSSRGYGQASLLPEVAAYQHEHRNAYSRVFQACLDTVKFPINEKVSYEQAQTLRMLYVRLAERLQQDVPLFGPAPLDMTDFDNLLMTDCSSELSFDDMLNTPNSGYSSAWGHTPLAIDAPIESRNPPKRDPTKTKKRLASTPATDRKVKKAKPNESEPRKGPIRLRLVSRATKADDDRRKSSIF